MWIDDKITKEIFEDDSKYIVHVNYAEISPNNISNYKKTTYEKEEDEFDEVDEFQIKFSNYVDSKMKKSSKKQTESDNNINKQLYYPLFDINLKREKRKSNLFGNNHSKIISLTDKNKFSLQNNNTLNRSKLNRNKSDNNLNKQTFIQIKDDKIILSKKNTFKEKNHKNNPNYMTKSNFKDLNKIRLFTYRCTQKEQNILNDLKNFEFVKNIDNLSNEFNKNSDILLIDWENNKYNYKIYQFLLDKIFVIDLYVFILEFSDDTLNMNIDEENEKFLIQLNSILLRNNIALLNNKNLIIDYFCNNREEIGFIINKNIPEEEYKVINIILKDYLKGNVYENSNDEIKYMKNFLKTNKTPKNKDLDKNSESFENEKKVQLYFITETEYKTLNIIQKRKKFTLIISTKYVYDSLLIGYLIDLNNSANILKYQIYE